MNGRWFLVMALTMMLSSCGERKKEQPSADSAAQAPATAVKTATETGPNEAPLPRPASISDEMNETFKDYVVAFEKLAHDLVSAGSDCKKAVAELQRNTVELEALAARGAKLRAQMPKAEEESQPAALWFATTYGSRFKRAIEPMSTLIRACSGDPDLQAAMAKAMEQFPMMSKKGS